MACASTKGAAPATPGVASTRSSTGRQSRMRPSGAVTTPWALRLSRRLRSSCSKPFITESTTTRAATPTATPSSETSEMNETKRLARRARR